MHVSLMQRIDYWIGVPLCFLLSLWHEFLKLFRPPPLVQPKKILFIELSEMGSAIIAYSTLVKAQAIFPNSELFFLIFRKNRESVDVLDVIPRENVVVIDERNFVSFAFSTVAALFRIWRLRIDTTVDMELFSRCTALISYLSRAKNRVGYDQYTGEGLFRGTFLTHRVMYNPHQHMALNFLALLYSLTVAREERPLLKRNLEGELLPLPFFKGSTEEERRVDEILAAYPECAGKDLVIINPDPGLLPLRGWPIDNFATLCRALAAESSQIAFVSVGLKHSKPISDAVLGGLPQSQVVDLTGATKTLRELMVLFTRARLLITNDSGPAHFAALTPISSIVLFGPETPKLYSPLSPRCHSVTANLSCSPCFAATNHRRSACNDNKCMKAIPVSQILDLSRRVLGLTSSANSVGTN